MAVIGDLVATLSLDNKQFNRGIEKSRSRMARFARSMQQWGRKIGRAFTSMAQIGAAAFAGLAVGLGVWINNTIQATHQTHQFAKALGTTTGQLQAVSYAFQQMGINADKAVDIIKDVEDKIGDAALTGGGELAPILKKLELSAQKLVQLNPVQQLTRIGEAISGLPKAKQVTIMEALADDATRLLPLLDNNAEALKRFTQQARDLNIALSETETKRLEKAYDAIRNIKAAFQGLGNTLAIALAPAIDALVPLITNLIKKFSDFIEKAAETGQIKAFFQEVAKVARVAWQVVKALAAAMGVVIDSISAVADAVTTSGVREELQATITKMDHLLEQ